MKLFSNISLKLIAPIFIVLFSLSSCTKGDEPVPSSNIGSDNVSVIIIDDSSLNSQSARTVKTVVGGDDNEDDDDNRDEFGNHR